MLSNSKKRDFTEGPIFWRLTVYSVPIMLTSLLQILYNMADNIIVGQFSGDDLAFAAISSTGSITGTFVNIMIGFSLGTGILIAQYYGAKNDDAVSRTVHTSITLSLVIGIAFMTLGFILSEPLFEIMNIPDDIYRNAMLYVRIILIGVPAQAIYNFAASILRSVGDSRTPLIILAGSGIINVALNLVFVVILNMSVAGVAIATVVSQYASAIAVIAVLMRRKTCYRLYPKKLKIERKILLRVTKLGLPSAIQSAAFNLSSMVLTSSINELGSIVISAFGLSSQIESLCYSIMNSYQAAAMTFAAQNFGALKIKRIKKVSVYSLFWVTTVGIFMGQLILLLSEPIASLYLSSDNALRSDIIKAAAPILTIMLCSYFICGIMNVMTGILRGLGYSILSMIICVSCIVGGRLVWIVGIYPLEPFYKNVSWLVAAYPISWSIAAIIFSIILVAVLRRLAKRYLNTETIDSKSIRKAA